MSKRKNNLYNFLIRILTSGEFLIGLLVILFVLFTFIIPKAVQNFYDVNGKMPIWIFLSFNSTGEFYARITQIEESGRITSVGGIFSTILFTIFILMLFIYGILHHLTLHFHKKYRRVAYVLFFAVSIIFYFEILGLIWLINEYPKRYLCLPSLLQYVMNKNGVLICLIAGICLLLIVKNSIRILSR